MRIWLKFLGLAAGLLGAAGVALSAVGAHLSGDPIVTTAAQFLLFHAGALLALIAIMRPRRDFWLHLSATILLAGALLFSGDLALRALAHITLLRLAAPTGGLFLIAGWLIAGFALLGRLAPADDL
jgi:uncharacterized membrane protein YgdD (TMEM256/DUF423 family)